jgi:hypothetical protein
MSFYNLFNKNIVLEMKERCLRYSDASIFFKSAASRKILIFGSRVFPKLRTG